MMEYRIYTSWITHINYIQERISSEAKERWKIHTFNCDNAGNIIILFERPVIREK